ncbi:MAG: hypothetical protein QXN24_00005 [Candidatus Bathyarchaeia archaeon]
MPLKASQLFKTFLNLAIYEPALPSRSKRLTKSAKRSLKALEPASLRMPSGSVPFSSQ